MKSRSVPTIPVHRYELSSGALLLVSPRAGAPVSAVQVHVRGGHSLDPEGLDGTAYLAGRLVELGTKDLDEEALASALEPVSGSLVGGSTGITGQVAGSEWKTLLELLAHCLVRPSYPRAKVEREKRRLLDRLAVERDDPRVQGAWGFRKLVYGSHWLGKPEYGTYESVRNVERKHLVEHHGKHWCGARIVIAFSGDVDPDAVRRFLSRRLADLPRGRELEPISRRFPRPAARRACFPAKRQQVHVFLGHLGIERNHPDYAKLVVMDHILGTGPGFTSRITRVLRDELGLAYTVQAAIHANAGVLPGTFTAYIGTSPEHLETAVAGFEEEMRRIQAELVLPAELELARSYLTGSLALGFERASQRVQSIVSALRTGLPDDYLARLVAEIGTVTREDVREVARRHLRPDESCLMVAGPVTRKRVRAL